MIVRLAVAAVLLSALAAAAEGSSQRAGISRGTTWCGLGNVSSSSLAIDGAFTSVDNCCRIHDSCPAIIPAMSTRFGYYNYRMFTISHCECDEEFRSCLKMASGSGQSDAVKEKAANIGNLFFNNALASCFRMNRVRTCEQRLGNGECLKYKVERKIRIFSLRYF